MNVVQLKYRTTEIVDYEIQVVVPDGKIDRFKNADTDNPLQDATDENIVGRVRQFAENHEDQSDERRWVRNVTREDIFAVNVLDDVPE
jgi:hypothetical protein